MQSISDNINNKFHNLFITKNKVHPFFYDIKKVLEAKKDYMSDMKQYNYEHKQNINHTSY